MIITHVRRLMEFGATF